LSGLFCFCVAPCGEIIMALEPSTYLTSSRRGLLQSLLTLVGASGAARVAGAGELGPALAAPTLTPTPAPPLAAQTLLLRSLLQTSPVAGFQFHAGEVVWAQMRPGDSLALVRESQNRYDQRAVRLEWNGEKIGYVPRVDNAAISQLLDRDACLDAVITELRESADPWERIEFAVYLTLAA
jgi:hypothetical protein